VSSLLGPLRQTLGFLKQFSIFLAAQGVFFVALYFRDTKLKWYWTGAEGERVWARQKAGSRVNIRPALLWIAYPLVSAMISAVLGCVVASQSFSRGLQIGHKHGGLLSIFTCVTESVLTCDLQP
jgi:hypothetical protein